MSHAFVIREVHDLGYGPVIGDLPFDDVTCAETPEPPGDWPHGSLYLYAERVSCRPVECHYDGERMVVRIFPASSPDDYRLAVALAARIADKDDAVIEPPDAEPMNAATFRERYDDAWAADQCAVALRSMVSALEQSGEEMTVAGARRDLRVGPRLVGSLTKESHHLVEDFFERFRRLQYIDREEVFLAPSITLRDEAGSRAVTVAVLSEAVPTVLSDDVDAVVLRGHNDASLQIGLEDLLTLLGERVRPLSEELLLFDALEGDRWRRLFDDAAPHRLEDLFTVGEDLPDGVGGPDATSSENPRLDAQDLGALAMGPFLAFLLVAGADGPVDRKQAAQFTRSLAAAVDRHESPVREVFTEALENFREYLNEIKGEVQIVGRIRSLADVIDRSLPASPSAAYRMALLLLAREVAEASGGGLLGLGDKVSEREQKAIAALAVLLGLAN
jgi:hypothetical protein